METFEKMEALLAETRPDLEKFNSNGNKSAGTRVRQSMQALKKLAQDLRIEIQSAKNNG